MSGVIISIRKYDDGREGYAVLPVESLAAFEDLLRFIVSDFDLEKVDQIDGPGSTVIYLRSAEGEVSLVLNDMTGAEISGRRFKDNSFAQRIARGVEDRIREIRG